MPSLPRITGAAAVKAFERLGFVVDRVSGSHHILKKPGNPNRLSIPVHAGRTLGLGLLKSLISAAEVSVEDFIEQL